MYEKELFDYLIANDKLDEFLELEPETKEFANNELLTRKPKTIITEEESLDLENMTDGQLADYLSEEEY